MICPICKRNEVHQFIELMGFTWVEVNKIACEKCLGDNKKNNMIKKGEIEYEN